MGLGHRLMIQRHLTHYSLNPAGRRAGLGLFVLLLVFAAGVLAAAASTGPSAYRTFRVLAKVMDAPPTETIVSASGASKPENDSGHSFTVKLVKGTVDYLINHDTTRSGKDFKG